MKWLLGILIAINLLAVSMTAGVGYVVYQTGASVAFIEQILIAILSSSGPVEGQEG